MAFHVIAGNRLTAQERLDLGYAGLSLQWQPPAGVEVPLVSLHVGETERGRGLFLDKGPVGAGTVVASASGAVVELPTARRTSPTAPSTATAGRAGGAAGGGT